MAAGIDDFPFSFSSEVVLDLFGEIGQEVFVEETMKDSFSEDVPNLVGPAVADIEVGSGQFHIDCVSFFGLFLCLVSIRQFPLESQLYGDQVEFLSLLGEDPYFSFESGDWFIFDSLHGEVDAVEVDVLDTLLSGLSGDDQLFVVFFFEQSSEFRVGV